MALSNDPPVSLETFLASIQMIYQHLRLKELDRWTPATARIKHFFLVEEYATVSDRQFMWACEQWIQSTAPGTFHRMPTWNELMRFLFKGNSAGPQKGWGFRDDLPPYISPTSAALSVAKAAVALLAPPPDAEEPGAYKLVTPARAGSMKPPAVTAPSLEESWQAYKAGSWEAAEDEVSSLLGSKPTRVLETMLLKGMTSIRQFNASYPSPWQPWLRPHFPRLSFLGLHPQFDHLDFRDMDAFHAWQATGVDSSPLADKGVK
jgi:hypothetical protein